MQNRPRSPLALHGYNEKRNRKFIKDDEHRIPRIDFLHIDTAQAHEYAAVGAVGLENLCYRKHQASA